jgi:cell division protein FtsQ
MEFKINIRRELKIAAVLLVLFGLIAFTERMKGEIAVHDIQIKIENVQENHFVDEQDIIRLMQIDQKILIGTNIQSLNFREIENKIKNDPFIKDAQLYNDLKGILTVRVELRRPVARLVRNDGPDGYIAEDGTIMPVSEKFTSRVILLSGTFVPKFLKIENILNVVEGKALMEMIRTIREDDFWKAQIAQLDIDNKLKVTIFSQVGDEKIEFGKPENLDVKFKKLRIFYKEILPRVGWNKYDRVNLEYEGQIVAE